MWRTVVSRGSTESIESSQRVGDVLKSDADPTSLWVATGCDWTRLRFVPSEEATRLAKELRERHEEQLAEAGHELGDPAEVLAKVRRLDPRRPPPLPRAPRRAPADTAFASCALAARDLPVVRR